MAPCEAFVPEGSWLPNSDLFARPRNLWLTPRCHLRDAELQTAGLRDAACSGCDWPRELTQLSQMRNQKSCLTCHDHFALFWLRRQEYRKLVSGTGALRKAKDLLLAYLKSGRDVKGQHYQEQLATLTETRSQKTREGWVPWATICTRYGEQEALRRLNRGTLQARRCDEDPAEWEFLEVIKTNTTALDFQKAWKMGETKALKGPEGQASFEAFQELAGMPKHVEGSGLPSGMLKDLGIQAKTLKNLKMDEESAEESAPESSVKKSTPARKGPMAIKDAPGKAERREPLEKMSQVHADDDKQDLNKKAEALKAALLKAAADLQQLFGQCKDKRACKISAAMQSDLAKRADALGAFVKKKSEVVDKKQIKGLLWSALNEWKMARAHKVEMLEIIKAADKQ